MKPEYQSTHFYTPEEWLPDDFWLITAYNPNGEDASHEQNERRDSDLFNALTDFDVPPIRIYGRSPDGTHEEAGWGAEITSDEAMEFAEEFEQEAVYHFIAGQIYLVDRSPRTRTWLPNPEKRIHLKHDAGVEPILCGDSDYIWNEILEWAGIAELWSEHELWDEFSVEDDLLQQCPAASVDSRMVHVNRPGGSDATFYIFSDQPELLKKQMRERTDQLLNQRSS
jgi:hypothetical protein